MTVTPKAGESPADSSPAEAFVFSLPDEPASGKDWYLWAGVLALLVLVAFLPAATGQFIWDDDHHVGVIAALESVHGLAKIWMPLDNATPQYYPLTTTSFWIEHHFWQDTPLGYHLVNFLLQAASAVVVWRLLRRLAVPGAWLAAAIWAVHPLQAETVCWISERKNLLSGLLFFSSIWFYLEFAGLTPPAKKAGIPGLSADGSTVVLGNGGFAYAVSWVLFVLALLAKTVACAMPAVMIVVLWWKRRKLGAKSLWPLAPFFLAGLIMAGITVFRETAQGGTVEARGADWALTPAQRLLVAGRAFWFYIFKLVWPTQLTFSYPRVLPNVDGLQWLYVVGAVAVFLVLWLRRDRLGRGPMAAALYYGVTLFPALGFINVFPMKYSFVADHFQYLSGLGLIVLAVAAVSSVLARLGAPLTPVKAVVGTCLVLTLSAASWLQAHIYESPLALWRDTLAKNPDSWMAADNLGIQLIELGEQQQRDAANDQAEGLTDLAATDRDQSSADFQEAERLFKRVVQFRPTNYATHNALGLLYRQMGRWAEAESELRTAVDMDEKDDKAHQLTAPYVNYAQVLQHNHPDADPRPWLNLASDLADQPRIKLKPTDMAMVHLAYGDFWFRQAGLFQRTSQADQELADLNNAIRELDAGLRIDPTDVSHMYDMARAYQREGQIDQNKADQAEAAGRVAEAEAFQNRSLHVDDAQAMQLCQAIFATVTNGRHAGAWEEMGELYFHGILDAQAQHEAVQNLLRGIDSFERALSIDPEISGAAQYLAAANHKLIDEGNADQVHESTWAALHQKVDALLSGTLSRNAALDADRVVHSALWPLPQIHPMRLPLEDLHLAIETYVLPGAPPEATANLQTAARAVIGAMSNRDASRDAVNDAVAAALCFEGALAADEHSALAWRDLKSATTTLAVALAKRSDVPGAKEALDRASVLLSGYAAATQPSTKP